MPPSRFVAHVRARLPRLDLDPHREAEIVEELAQQLEQTFDAARSGGASEDAAMADADASIGDWGSLARSIVSAERSRAAQVAGRVVAPIATEPGGSGALGPWLRSIWQDARHGVRWLTKHPGFASAALLTLALTVGASSAIFSLVNAVLLRPLPFTEPDRLAALFEAAPEVGFDQIPFSPPDYVDYIAAQTSFDALAVYRTTSVELATGSESQRVDVARVTSALWTVLGVSPALGRGFTADEGRPGSTAAVLSHAAWQRYFSGDPQVVGKTVLLDRQPFVVVGVMPARVAFPLPGSRFNSQAAEVFVPMAFTDEELQARGGFFSNSVVGRLKPGVTRAAAQAEATTIADAIYANYPSDFKAAVNGAQLQFLVVSLHESASGRSRVLVLVLFGAVVLLLLAGCANVGSLLLALTTSRQRELAVRASLGAARGRLASQLLTESVVLAGLGGVLGLGLAWVLLRVAPQALPAGTPGLSELGIDATVLAFTVLASLATAVLFGVAPSMRWSAVDPAQAMQAAGSRGVTAGGARARRTLAILQCAFAVLLLVPAGLLARTMWTLLSRNAGFEGEHVLSMSTNLPVGAYGTDGVRIAEFYRQAVERLAAVPGARAVGASMDMPLEPRERRGIVVEGYEIGGGAAPPIVAYSWVTPGYLEALSVPVTSGRSLLPSDTADGQRVALVSTSAARKFWPGTDPVGKRMKSSTDAPWAIVVGVVGDVREDGLDKEPGPHVYAAIAQVDRESLGENIVGQYRNPHLVAATTGSTTAVGGLMRDAIRGLDDRLALPPATTLDELSVRTLGTQRLAAVVVGTFSVAALLIAALGLHGVLAFGVAQRQRELGIRLALGATPRRLRGLVARDGLGLAVVGLLIGLGGAYATTGWLQSMLVGVAPGDPMTFAAVGLVVLAAAACAVWLPARSATRIDPATTIREV